MSQFLWWLLGVATPELLKLLNHVIKQFFTPKRKLVLFGWFRRRTTCRLGWHSWHEEYDGYTECCPPTWEFCLYCNADDDREEDGLLDLSGAFGTPVDGFPTCPTTCRCWDDE